MQSKLRIAIIGVGGIGGYFGVRLLDRYGKDGNIEIAFIQRGEHLRQIVKHGLTYVTEKSRYQVHPALATDKPEDAGKFNLIILCIKSYDLESSLNTLTNNIDSTSIIISTLNGVNIARRVKSIYPDSTVLPGCIYISTNIDKPGVIKQTGGIGKFYFGPENGQIEQYTDIENILLESKIKAVLDPQIKTRLWEKYIFVCAFATITSYYNKSIGEIISDKDSMCILMNLLQEIINLAKSKGITISDNIIDKCLERAQIIPFESKTSMQLDFELGKRTELDIFTGYVVEESSNLGISTPWFNKLFRELNRIR